MGTGQVFGFGLKFILDPGWFKWKMGCKRFNGVGPRVYLVDWFFFFFWFNKWVWAVA